MPELSYRFSYIFVACLALSWIFTLVSLVSFLLYDIDKDSLSVELYVSGLSEYSLYVTTWLSSPFYPYFLLVSPWLFLRLSFSVVEFHIRPLEESSKSVCQIRKVRIRDAIMLSLQTSPTWHCSRSRDSSRRKRTRKVKWRAKHVQKIAEKQLLKIICCLSRNMRYLFVRWGFDDDRSLLSLYPL